MISERCDEESVQSWEGENGSVLGYTSNVAYLLAVGMLLFGHVIHPTEGNEVSDRFK